MDSGSRASHGAAIRREDGTWYVIPAKAGIHAPQSAFHTAPQQPSHQTRPTATLDGSGTYDLTGLVAVDLDPGAAGIQGPRRSNQLKLIRAFVHCIHHEAAVEAGQAAVVGARQGEQVAVGHLDRKSVV